MKTLEDFRQQLDEVQGEGRYVYGSDSKQIPTIGSDGRPKMRVVRARRIKVGDKAPDPRGISAPDVGDSDQQDKNRSIGLYTKYYKKYMAALKDTDPKKVRKESTEMVTEKMDTESAPFVLMLKRKYIRLMDNKLKVAVYYNDKINKYFMVPVTDKNDAVIQAESVISEKELVTSFLKMYEQLSEENRQKVFEMLQNDETYNQLKKFTVQNINE